MRFWHSSIWVFRWLSYRSFNLLPGFMKRNVLLVLHFDDFFFDLPFRATSHICWMIAMTIGTFCYVVTFMIVMSSLSTFCFVLAESFVVAVFLTIKTTLWIWNVNFSVTNQETNFDLRGYVWTINGQYVWIGRYQLPILSPQIQNACWFLNSVQKRVNSTLEPATSSGAWCGYFCQLTCILFCSRGLSTTPELPVCPQEARNHTTQSPPTLVHSQIPGIHGDQAAYTCIYKISLTIISAIVAD